MLHCTAEMNSWWTVKNMLADQIHLLKFIIIKWNKAAKGSIYKKERLRRAAAVVYHSLFFFYLRLWRLFPLASLEPGTRLATVRCEPFASLGAFTRAVPHVAWMMHHNPMCCWRGNHLGNILHLELQCYSFQSISISLPLKKCSPPLLRLLPSALPLWMWGCRRRMWSC